MSNIILVANTALSIYNFRRNLMLALKNEGMEVLALANPDASSDLLIQQGFQFQPLENLNDTKINFIDDMKLIFELYKIYSALKPVAVLHYQIKPSIYGSIAAKFANTKSIITVTGTGRIFFNKDLKYFLASILYNIAFLCAEKVFFQNKDNREFFTRWKLLKENRTELVGGSGVDLHFFSPDFCHDLKNHSNLTFLLIGRMLWEKGIGEFVEAARNIKRIYPNVTFQLLGPIGKELDAIPAKIIKNWENEKLIEYYDFVYDVRPFICQSDVIVLPSYHEGLPRSLLEAMAMGKPIITTDSYGCKDVIYHNKNGIMVSIKDIEALTNAMKQMIDIGINKRKEMGNYGRNKAITKFNEKNVIAAYIKTIKNLCN